MDHQPMNKTPATASPSAVNAVATWWAARPAREQRLLRAAALLVSVALLWTVAIAPAWRTVRTYPEQRGALDRQLQTMQALQAQAQALRAQPAADPRTAPAALESAVKSLGPQASLTVADGQATVTLRKVDAETLARWLARTRSEVRIAPTQAKLQNEGGAWSGTVQFTLPGL